MEVKVSVSAFSNRCGDSQNSAGMEKEPQLLFDMQKHYFTVYSFIVLSLPSALSILFFSRTPFLSYLLSTCHLLVLHFPSPLLCPYTCLYLLLCGLLWLQVLVVPQPKPGQCYANFLHQHHWPTWLPAQEQLGNLLCLPKINK